MPPKEPCPDMAGTLIARPRPNGEAVSGHRPAKIPNWRKSTPLSRVVLLGGRLLPRRHPSPRSACRPGRGLNSMAPPRAKPRRLGHERGRRFSWWGRSRPTTISCLMHVGGSFRPPPPMPNLQFRPCARRADKRQPVVLVARAARDPDRPGLQFRKNVRSRTYISAASHGGWRGCFFDVTPCQIRS